MFLYVLFCSRLYLSLKGQALSNLFHIWHNRYETLFVHPYVTSTHVLVVICWPYIRSHQPSLTWLRQPPCCNCCLCLCSPPTTCSTSHYDWQFPKGKNHRYIFACIYTEHTYACTHCASLPCSQAHISSHPHSPLPQWAVMSKTFGSIWAGCWATFHPLIVSHQLISNNLYPTAMTAV